MQVDPEVLRTASKRLRDDVVPSIEQALRSMGGYENGPLLSYCFDVYTGPEPFSAVAKAWTGEVDALRRAVEQLADAMKRAADEYDAVDARAQSRMSHGAL